jgi:AAA15 family ATPase/GTPase
MSLSSSLVTEVTPIILALRHVRHIPVLILEEPEAHLHPKLQRKLAQVVVRLIRKGLYVWITTHSENFCQQINNFMKLGALDPSRRAEAQQKLGYGEQDYLEFDDVGGYEFKLDETGERSIVTPLKKKERGLVMPTFNKELLALGKEIDFLNEQDEE